MQQQKPIAAKLKKLGISLPVPNIPRANYIPVKQVDTILFVSGQVPRVEGVDHHIGKVGRDISLEQANDAARICALNMLSQLSAALDGDLDRVKGCVRLRGYVNATEDFGAHAAVINGASDLLVQVFGEGGRHTRTAIGVGSLPHGFAVEVDADFELHAA